MASRIRGGAFSKRDLAFYEKLAFPEKKDQQKCSCQWVSSPSPFLAQKIHFKSNLQMQHGISQQVVYVALGLDLGDVDFRGMSG
jgi:hypothetical protein